MNNGGPAFPVPNDANRNGEPGMSLRDFFAGMAIMGKVGSLENDDRLAKWAYILADAMLAERHKP